MLYGPLNKSLFTQELELVAKCLLNSSNVKLSIQHNTPNKGELHANFGGLDINLSKLLKKANFSHISFNDADSKQYCSTLSSSHKNDANAPYSDQLSLTKAEKLAITGYSGCDYEAINCLLYNNMSTVPYSYTGLKHTFLETMMLASGLNKIVPNVDLHQATYRGEHASYTEISNRIDLINNQGQSNITETKAFLSTSLDFGIAYSFKDKSMIVFDAPYGKSIASLSYFPSESEFLLLPSKILWESYEKIDNTYIFHAKIVEPLVPGEDAPNQQEIDTFNKLLDWAKNNNISTDFITPYLTNNVLKNPQSTINHKHLAEDQESQKSLETMIQSESKVSSPIHLTDCISLEQNLLEALLEPNSSVADTTAAANASNTAPQPFLMLPLVIEVHPEPIMLA